MQVFWGKKRSFWMVLLLPFACTEVLKSQTISSNYRMRPLTVNNGLPQGWITDIKQDSKGFIWMGASGLARYDGRTFLRYQHQSKDSGSLLKNDLLSIQTDDAGNLWIIYNPTDTRFPTKPVDVYNIATGKIRHISEEARFSWMKQLPNIGFIIQKGSRYFIENHQQLFTFDLPTGQHQSIPLPIGEEFLSIGEDRHHQIWVTTTNHLCKLLGNSLVPVAAVPVAASSNMAAISALLGGRTHSESVFEDDAGNIVALGLTCIFAYQPSTGQFHFSPLPIDKHLPVGLTKAKDGRFFFLLAGNIWQLGNNALQATPVERVTGEAFVEPLLTDQSGTVWAIKEDATGLRLFDFQPPNFHSFTYKNGFSHDVLEPWLHNPISWQDMGSYNTRQANDAAGNIWVLNHTMRRVNGQPVESNTIYQLTANGAIPFPDKGNKPLQLSFDKQNQLWVVHSDGAFFYLDKVNAATGSFQRFYNYPIQTDNQYNGYLTCAGDKLCIIDGHRLRIYNVTTNACTIYNDTQLGFEKAMLMTVPDPHNKDEVWISSQGSGIGKLNLLTGKIIHLTEAEGLPNNTVYMMVPDEKGRFWCSSNKGLFRFNPADGNFVSFGVEDGLPGNEFNRFHFLETPDGHFVFGGTEGYTVFHPDSVYIDNFKPAPVISSVLINNQPFSSTVPHLQDSIVTGLDRLELPYNQNFISFSFSALQYSNPAKIRYRYMLVGLEKDWVIAGPEATATYTFLPPGTYTLKLNASNTDGIWSNQVKTLGITILPPWWKTGWAYLIYLLLAGAIVYAIYRIWLRRAKTQQKLMLQQKEAEQLRAMDEMKTRFFSNITHEFRTPLSLIIGPLEQMQRSGIPAEWKSQIKGVQRNAAQLLQLINQLLDLAKLEAAAMKVDLSGGSLVDFIQEISDGFKPQANAKKLSLRFEAPTITEEYLFDTDKLQKILVNLLSNAVKFTPEGGQILIQLQTQRKQSDEKDIFEITVIDTGIGILPDKLPFVFNRFYQADDSRTRTYTGTGIGLALVKELAELMDGNLSAAAASSGTGTVFTLILPLAKAFNQSLPTAKTELFNSEVFEPSSVHDTNDQLSDKPLLLIAEDNEELRAFTASNFRSRYRVVTAANGKEGLELARQELPDIILSDAMMPEMDGYTFCREIKNTPETSHIAFVLLTAKTARESVVEGLQSKADDYLTKPFSVEELQLRISNMLHRQHLLRDYYKRQLTVPQEVTATSQPEDPFLQKLYAYLEEHLDEADLSVENLANAVAMSQRTLTRKLNTIAGLTGSELIKQYRLKKAAALLIEGRTVSETAFATGYDNPNYFSTAFKSFYGVSPTEYVKTYSKTMS